VFAQDEEKDGGEGRRGMVFGVLLFIVSVLIEIPCPVMFWLRLGE